MPVKRIARTMDGRQVATHEACMKNGLMTTTLVYQQVTGDGLGRLGWLGRTQRAGLVGKRRWKTSWLRDTTCNLRGVHVVALHVVALLPRCP